MMKRKRRRMPMMIMVCINFHQEAKDRKEKMDLDDEELRQKVVQEQIERDKLTR